MALHIVDPGRRQFRRPDTPMGVDWSRNIARGLVSFVDERNGFDYGRNAIGSFTGTTRRGSVYAVDSLTRGYGSTLGVGITDALSLGSQSWTTDWSIAVWVWRNGAPNVGPRIVDNGSTGILFLWLTASSVWQVSRITTGTTGVWTFPAADTGQWYLFVVTQTGTSAPVVYVNGASVTPTTVTPPTGSAMNVAATLFVGNRAGGDRNFDGLISGFARWNRALSDGEAWSLYDPDTRWDLYLRSSRRVYFDAPSGVSYVPRLALLGVG